MTPLNWHRMFGLILTDFFTGSPFKVELEMDLSIKQQFLDVVVIRRIEGVFEGELPDGMDNFSDHNLISFKSHQEALDPWAIKELIGHYVNYRKQASPSMQTLLPENIFRLYCVSARYPQSLASAVDLEELSEGVYQCQWADLLIRILVANRLPEHARNAMIHLFSAEQNRVEYGRSHYHQHTEDVSTVIRRLFTEYREEGFPMPYTMEDFKREMREELKEEYEEVRREFMQSVKEEVKQEILKELTPEALRRRLTSEERLEGLSMEEIQAYLDRLRAEEKEEQDKTEDQTESG